MPLKPEDCLEEITKEEFDSLARARRFIVGPLQEGQSEEYGAPYIAPLWLFGQLDNNRKVKAKRF